jgi:xanthine dehydrogenase YagT iron-sulfur-binding subunit
MDQPAEDRGPNRRSLMGGAAGIAAAPVIANAAPAPRPAPRAATPNVVAMVLNVNGQDRSLNADVRTSLLDALREHLDLTGSKKGCDQGQCGACTVHIDGERVLGCLTLAVAAQGRKITTIEGLAGDGHALHPMQQAFIDHDGFQCGYCTPGQIMSAVACVKEGHAKTDEDIREYMSGNLCRCAAYPNIVAAIKQARGQMEQG